MSRPRFLRSSWLVSQLLRLLDWMFVFIALAAPVIGVVVVMRWLGWL